MTSQQLTETRSNDFVIGLGYKIADLNLLLRRKRLRVRSLELATKPQPPIAAALLTTWTSALTSHCVIRVLLTATFLRSWRKLQVVTRLYKYRSRQTTRWANTLRWRLTTTVRWTNRFLRQIHTPLLHRILALASSLFWTDNYIVEKLKVLYIN